MLNAAIKFLNGLNVMIDAGRELSAGALQNDPCAAVRLAMIELTVY